MSEPKNSSQLEVGLDDDVSDALEMLGEGYGPVVQFEPPATQIVETDDGYRMARSLGWVKISTHFRERMLRQLKGAKLSVFLCICLHVNKDGKSFPSFETIAEETGLHRDTVMVTVQELEQIPGLLTVVRKVGKSNTYAPAFAARGAGNDPIVPPDQWVKPPLVEDSSAPPVEVLPTTPVEDSSTLSREERKELSTTGVPYDRQKGREEAKKRKAAQRAAKADPLDWFVSNAEKVEAIESMRRRVEAACGLNLVREWDKPQSDWYGYEKELIKRERETGETIEGFFRWFNDDEFLSKSQRIWIKPAKIEMWWTQAYPESDPENDVELDDNGFGEFDFTMTT